MDERMSEWLMNAMKWKEMKGNEKNNMKGIKRKEMKRIKGMKWMSWPGQWTNARTNAWPLQMNFSSQRYFFSHHSLPSFFHSDFFPRYFLWASSSLSYHFSEHRGTIGPKATPTSKSGVQPSCLIFLAVGNGRARKRSNTNPPLATPEPQDLWNHIVSGTSLLSPDHCTDTMFCTLADYSWLVLCMMAASLRLVKKTDFGCEIPILHIQSPINLGAEIVIWTGLNILSCRPCRGPKLHSSPGQGGCVASLAVLWAPQLTLWHLEDKIRKIEKVSRVNWDGSARKEDAACKQEGMHHHKCGSNEWMNMMI